MRLPQFILDVQNFVTPLIDLRCYVELRALRESIPHTLPGYQLTYLDTQLNRLASIREATAAHQELDRLGHTEKCRRRKPARALEG
jgi:hypothetical protein